MKICVLQLHRGRKRLLEDGDRVRKPCAGTHHQHPAQQHPSPHHHHQQQHRHKHPEPQMRQRLAVLEARLSQLRPEEPRPPTSSSHSIGSKSNHQSLNRVMWLFLQVSWWKQNLSQTPSLRLYWSALSPAITFSVMFLEGRLRRGQFQFFNWK